MGICAKKYNINIKNEFTIINKMSVTSNSTFDEIGTWAKALEDRHMNVLSNGKYTILRVDGRSFSKMTKKYDKPHDVNISNAMRQATIAWCKEFNAVFGYTQSDEASCVLDAGMCLPFGGRSLKLCTVSAAYFTAVFNKHMSDEGLWHFDCRVMQVGTKDEVESIIYWRRLDCFRNGVAGIARSLGVATDHMRTINLIDRIGEYEFTRPVHEDLLYGTFIKRKAVQKNAVDPRNGTTISVVRMVYDVAVCEKIIGMISRLDATWLCSAV